MLHETFHPRGIIAKAVQYFGITRETVPQRRLWIELSTQSIVASTPVAGLMLSLVFARIYDGSFFQDARYHVCSFVLHRFILGCRIPMNCPTIRGLHGEFLHLDSERKTMKLDLERLRHLQGEIRFLEIRPERHHRSDARRGCPSQEVMISQEETSRRARPTSCINAVLDYILRIYVLQVKGPHAEG